MLLSPENVASQGIFAAEVELDKSLADNHYPGRLRRVPLVDFPAEQHRNLHRRQESGAGMQNPGSRVDGLTRDENVQPPAGAEERRVRKRRVADAGNRGESLPQILLERKNLRIAMTGLTRVQLVKQQVLAVESHVDRLQVGKRADE